MSKSSVKAQNESVLQQEILQRLRSTLPKKDKDSQKNEDAYLREFYGILEDEEKVASIPPEFKIMLASLIGNDIYSAFVFAFLNSEMYLEREITGSGLDLANLTQKLYDWIKANSDFKTDNDVKENYKHTGIANQNVAEIKKEDAIYLAAVQRLDNLSPTGALKKMAELDYAFYVIVEGNHAKEAKLNSMLSIDSQRIYNTKSRSFGEKNTRSPILSKEEYKARTKQRTRNWRQQHKENTHRLVTPAEVQKKFANYDDPEQRYHILQHKVIFMLNKEYVQTPRQKTVNTYHLEFEIQNVSGTEKKVWKVQPGYEKLPKEQKMDKVEKRSNRRQE